MTLPISAVIVIRNEGKILREYFEHLKDYVDEFVVADQCSTDNSLEICKEYGAKIFQTANFGYSEPNKEFVLNQIKNEWAITLDPDERFSNRILHNLDTILRVLNDGGYDSAEFKVKFFMDGYPIKSLSDMKQIRIVRKGTRCATRMHSNYIGFKPLYIDEEQFHFKHLEDHMQKEDERVELTPIESIKSSTVIKNNIMQQELERLQNITEEFNKNFVSYCRTFPKEIILETSINCNANCIMCPNHKVKRINRNISDELFKKVIDQCIGKNVGAIHPFMHGEPFVVPDIFDKLRYINEKLPDTEIVLISNGGAFTEDKARELLTIKNIRSLTFSIDAINPETYAKVRRGLDYNTTFNNILTFLGLNKVSDNPIKTAVSMTISNYNINENKEFYDFWVDKVDHVDRHRCTGRNKEVMFYGDEDSRIHFKNVPCKILWDIMCINTDGNISMCCEDYQPEVIIGNVNNQSIEEIWNSDKFNTIRRLHLEHKKDLLLVCKDCDVSI